MFLTFKVRIPFMLTTFYVGVNILRLFSICIRLPMSKEKVLWKIVNIITNNIDTTEEKFHNVMMNCI